MTIIVLIAASWLGIGAVGALLSCIGSLRYYGEDIYGPWMHAFTTLFGPAGFLASIVVWPSRWGIRIK
jgi:hypothetical protein